MVGTGMRSLFVAAVFVATPVRATPLVRRVSVGTGRVQGADASIDAAISSDGRYVAFGSGAPNLTGDGLGPGIFLRDRLNGTTERIPVTGGGPANMSRDARYVATNDGFYLHVYDRTTATTTDVYGFASPTFHLSGDGRHLVFTSTFSFVPADDGSGPDVYVYDLDSATMTLASVASDGTHVNSNNDSAVISADGRFVAFRSTASTLIPGDTNGLPDIFVRDTIAGTTVRVSVASGGGEVTDAWPTAQFEISDDGQLVAFASASAQLVPDDTNGASDVFVHDATTGTTTRASVFTGGGQGAGGSDFPTLSGDGRFVGFYSGASFDGQPGSGPYIHDRQTGTTTRLRNPLATPPFGGSDATILSLSPDGQFLVLRARDSTIVPADTNDPGNGAALAGYDTFVYDRLATCGNGSLEQDEDCDDGNAIAGDGCEPDCLRTLCAGGTVIDGARLRIRPGGVVSMKGDLVLPPGVPDTFDPSTTGVQIAVEDVSRGRSILEFSSRNGTPVPGGPACDVDDGWLVRHAGAVQRYLNRRSDALDPPLCTFGTAHALKSIRVRDRRAAKGVVSFVVQTDAFGTPPDEPLVGPFRMTVVLGAAAGDGLAGDCGTHTFAAADCVQQAGTTSCK